MKNNIFSIAICALCVAISGILLFSQTKPPQSGIRTVVRIDQENSHLGGGVAISPDGRMLAWVASDSRLHLRNIDTAQEKTLLEEASPGLDVFSNPEFSADGKLILFSASGGTRYYPSNIFSIQLDGSGLRQLTQAKPLAEENNNSPYAEYFQSAKESPDGMKILVGVYDSTAEKERVGLLDTNNKQVSYLADGQPISWSSDNQEIYYTQDGSLRSVNLQTKESRILTSLNGRIVGADQGEFAIDQNGTSALADLQDHSVSVHPWSVSLVAFVSQSQKNTSKATAEQLTLASVKWSKTSRLVLNYQGDTMERIEVIENQAK
ncbi:MAG: TolB family protein [Terriglobales bacterium]|jgi:WD40 repeat protein